MAEHDTNAPPLFELGDVSPAPTPAPAFMDLQRPDYAYMFGFLQADGHLAQGTGHKGRLTVEISVRDIAVLRAFQRLTPYNSSITERVRATNFSEEHHSAIWTLCDREARATVNGLGLPYGRKSKKITPPRVEFSRRDYLRGVIDADGSVGHTGQGLPFVSLTCLSLARKQTAATALASWERPADMPVRSPGRRWKPWEDRALLAHDDAETAAAELGRSAASCSVRLWRLKTGKVRRPEGGPAGA
ncbi:hypothetical protein [Streptomyces rubiginosohelvolus]|uniref:hypothetical protein n=1 Tax=Streptomyces rubiginosohelvolus TaxID=67362 RepID=UPI00340C7FE0